MAASEWLISYEDHMIHHQMLNRTISGQFFSSVKDQKADVKQIWGEAKQGISVQVISDSRDHDI